MSNQEPTTPSAPVAPPETVNIGTHDLTAVRLVLSTLIAGINAGPKSRQRSLVVTKLEEAYLWAGEALRVE